MKSEEAVENILNMFVHTKDNQGARRAVSVEQKYVLKTCFAISTVVYAENTNVVCIAHELQGLAGIARDSLPWQHQSGIGRESASPNEAQSAVHK